jgi:uncharacterized membrane protein YhaH (DUF805 family)
MNDYSNANSDMAALAGLGLIPLLIGLAIFVFMLFCYGKIFSKAGYSGWLALLMLVPIVNIVLFIWFAFADWPTAKKARGAA